MSALGRPFSRRTALVAAATGATVVMAGGMAAAAEPAAAGVGGIRVGGALRAVPAATVPSRWIVKPFDRTAVSLASSLFTANRDRILNFARKFPVDRMLYNFRVTAGLPTNGATPLYSWEDPASLLRGHFTGHYLSMLSNAYSGSGGAAEFGDRITAAVNGLKDCQDALAASGKYGAGYLAAYPEQQFDQLEVYTTYPTIWAPWYTCHKIMAGLLDCYDLAGNTTALAVVTKLGQWAFNRLSRTTEAQRQKMWGMYIAGEYGGMNESLMRLYEITGNADFLTAAKFFDTTDLLNACAANQDTLDGLHANQHIPQFLGYLKVYDATGDTKYLTAVANFWDMVVPHRMYAHGGTGQGEIFRARDKVAGAIVGSTNAETCAAYNMLKVSRALFFHQGDPKYMDYYERALFNQILGSRRSSDSDDDPLVTYMLPVGPGVTRAFGNFATCCGGTGLENHTKYQDSIYFAAADDSALYVNLYIPSTLTWAAKSVTVTQTTQMPVTGAATLTIGGSGTFAVKLRVPGWVQDGFTVSVNGQQQSVTATPGSYVTLSRSWADGDTIKIGMPLRLHLERTPDDPTLQAVSNGPIVLVARSSQGGYRKVPFYPTMTLAGKLDGTLKPTGTDGFFSSADGTVYAPLYVGSDDPYHMYLQRTEPSVVFGGVDSGVANPVKSDRTSLLDDIWSKAPFFDARQFAQTVADVSAGWVTAGTLSRRDRQAIVLAAARARFTRTGG